jgi:hypothetical protein
MNLELTEDNFVLYAMKNYDNPSCKGIEEFQDDLRRFRYLKRLFKKYTVGKGLKERLIINHIIVLYNLFGMDAATQMLFFKVEKKHWTELKTFLVFLNLFPIGVSFKVQGEVVEGYDIPLDEKIFKSLERII